MTRRIRSSNDRSGFDHYLQRIPAADLVPESRLHRFNLWLVNWAVYMAITVMFIAALTGVISVVDWAFSLFPRGL